MLQTTAYTFLLVQKTLLMSSRDRLNDVNKQHAILKSIEGLRGEFDALQRGSASHRDGAYERQAELSDLRREVDELRCAFSESDAHSPVTVSNRSGPNMSTDPPYPPFPPYPPYPPVGPFPPYPPYPPYPPNCGCCAPAPCACPKCTSHAAPPPEPPPTPVPPPVTSSSSYVPLRGSSSSESARPPVVVRPSSSSSSRYEQVIK